MLIIHYLGGIYANHYPNQSTRAHGTDADATIGKPCEQGIGQGAQELLCRRLPCRQETLLSQGLHGPQNRSLQARGTVDASMSVPASVAIMARAHGSPCTPRKCRDLP